MIVKLLRRLSLALFCPILLLSLKAIAQTTIHVGAGQPYATIQSGIDAANNGDTVLVAPGTYYENVSFKGKAITVTSSGGAAQTIIDGGARVGYPTIAFNNGETRSSVISGMTIRNGGTGNVSVFAMPSGGVFAYQSSPTILNNIITANFCQNVVSQDAAPLIQGNTISGAIGNTPGACLLDKGEAVLVFGYSSTFATGIVPTILNNTIENNAQGVYGDTGGVYLWAGNYTVIQGNIFRNNMGTEGGAIASANTNNVSILQNVMYGNHGGGAGAIWLLPPDASVGPFIGILAGNTIADNTVTYGQTYPGNSISSQVYLSGNLAQYVVVNNVIVNNAAGEVALNCDTSYSYLAVTPLVFDHNNIYAGPGGSIGGSCPSQTGEYGNISQDPQFTNTAIGDYSLHIGSPAIDSGNNSAPSMPATDFAGAVRIQDATGKGYPVVDMGAYEFSGQREVAPTILTLTPSEYFQFQYAPYTSLTFTATLMSAAGIPTGPVTVYVDNVAATTTNVGPTGTSTFVLPGLTPGLHAFTASYPGSGNFPPAVSVKFYLLIPMTATKLAITTSKYPSQLGTPVTFTITASAADGTIPSPITLTDKTNNTLLATLTPDSSGVATYTTSALAAGTHTIEAAYAGTSTYSAAAADTLQLVIDGSSTTTSLTCAPAIISVGGSALLTATVTSSAGTPTGSFTFSDNGATLGQSTATNGSGSFNYAGQTDGTHTLTATYVPTGSFAGSSASCSETVRPLPVVALLAANPATSTYGSPVTVTATVSAATPPGPSTPTGNVVFFNQGNAIGSSLLSGGVASVTVNNLAVPSDSLTCVYVGDSVYEAAHCDPVPIVVNAAATKLTLSSSNNPAPALSPVTFKAQLTVNGLPAGAGNVVTIVLNGQSISLSTDATGSVSYTTSALVPGSYPVTASFVATSSLQASSSGLTQIVVAASTATGLNVSPNPAYSGQSITMTATVAPQGTSTAVSTGSVTFFDGSTVLTVNPVNANGVATFTTSTLAVGTHAIQASYSPAGANPSFVGSTSAVVNEVVLASGFTIALAPTSIALPAGSSGKVAIQLASFGNFAGPLALSYGTLPSVATAAISPATVSLAAGGTGAATLTLNTLQKVSNVASTKPPSRDVPLVFAAVTLLLVPFSAKRRKSLLRLMSLALLACFLQTLTGCTNSWYIAKTVAAGTYQIDITATDVNHNSQTATLTVVVPQ